MIKNPTPSRSVINSATMGQDIDYANEEQSVLGHNNQSVPVDKDLTVEFEEEIKLEKDQFVMIKLPDDNMKALMKSIVAKNERLSQSIRENKNHLELSATEILRLKGLLKERDKALDEKDEEKNDLEARLLDVQRKNAQLEKNAKVELEKETKLVKELQSLKRKVQLMESEKEETKMKRTVQKRTERKREHICRERTPSGGRSCELHTGCQCCEVGGRHLGDVVLHGVW